MWHLNLAIKRLMVSSITMIFSHPFSDVSAFQCKALSRPPWGSMKCLPSASGPFHSGSSCEFSCDQGFELKGSTRLQCGPRGEWDSKKPTCSGAFSLEILFLSLPPSLTPPHHHNFHVWRSEANLQKSIFSLCTGPRNEIQLVGTGGSAFSCRAILLAPCDIL